MRTRPQRLTTILLTYVSAAWGISRIVQDIWHPRWWPEIADLGALAMFFAAALLYVIHHWPQMITAWRIDKLEDRIRGYDKVSDYFPEWPMLRAAGAPWPTAAPAASPAEPGSVQGAEVLAFPTRESPR